MARFQSALNFYMPAYVFLSITSQKKGFIAKNSSRQK